MLIAEGDGRRVHTLEAGRLRLDGGGMFGAVPRALWARYLPPDDRNRIELALRCLLIETGDLTILVDSGAGVASEPGLAELYGLEDLGEPTRLQRELRACGVEPEDVDIVVSTHLHFDHAGGHVRREEGTLVPAFPRARYLVRRGEWEDAHSGHPLLRASYLPADFDPLEAHGCLWLADGDLDLAPGVQTISMPGHTAHHQGVRVELGDRVILFPADLVPTAAHARLAWITAYDLDPRTTYDQKERWLERAGANDWWIVFEHDPDIAVARAGPATHGQGCALDVIFRPDGTADG